MELRHLRYFVAAAEEENVSRAALKLHVSQPGVSRQIRDLEQEIGFPLFERSAQALKLTAAGKVFLTGAKSVLQQAEAAVRTARSVAGGVQGEIHAGYAPSLTVQILPPALRAFQQQFPRVRVALHDLSTGEMLEQLRSGKLQVAMTVRVGPKMMRGLEFFELIRYPTCLAVSPKHPLAGAKSVTLDEVTRQPLIIYDRQDYPEYYAMIEKIFASVGRKPVIAEEHDGVSGIILAVESGNGAALVPSCIACLVGPRLKLIPFAPVGPEVSVIVAWKKPTLSGPVREFITTVKRVASAPL